MERKSNRTKQLVVRLTEVEHKRIVKAAAYADRSVSDWCRVVLKEHATYEMNKVNDPNEDFRRQIIERVFQKGS